MTKETSTGSTAAGAHELDQKQLLAYQKQRKILDEQLRTGEITPEQYNEQERELNQKFDPYGRIHS